MKMWLKQVLAPVARLSTRHSARIIMYHRFAAGNVSRKLSLAQLEEQIRFIRRHFKVVSLSALVSRLRSGMAPDHGSVALTVDDAYADFGALAYPVFRKWGVPVTIYVVSEFAGGKLWLWWDAIRFILEQARAGHHQIRALNREDTLDLSDEVRREAAWHALADRGLTLSPQERSQYLRDLQESFSVPLPITPVRDFAAMDWEALLDLDPAIVEIGSHTCTHPILSHCGPEQLDHEVGGSKRIIEARLGREVRAFCYPNGQWPDVNDQVMAAARNAGYESAVMACGTLVSKGADVFALERLHASHNPREFISAISGVAHLGKRLSA
jgi:peptidoglycan/xylan/chitin deacetylase (PgdA/CDA1 family)